MRYAEYGTLTIDEWSFLQSTITEQMASDDNQIQAAVVIYSNLAPEAMLGILSAENAAALGQIYAGGRNVKTGLMVLLIPDPLPLVDELVAIGFIIAGVYQIGTGLSRLELN